MRIKNIELRIEARLIETKDKITIELPDFSRYKEVVLEVGD